MTIRAYDSSYLQGAQNILGNAVDWSVMTLGLEPDTFGNAFRVSRISNQFASGNPKYIAGMNGCELARAVLTETCTPFTDTEDVMFLDKSPEYWAGWALAFYQWYSGRSFTEILSVFPLSRIISMYPACHEMDVLQFVDRIDAHMRQAYYMTRLRERRLNCGMSQSELAADAGVALRQIQLFEQRQRNINRASASTILSLSRSLHCNMEDLLEYQELVP